MSGVAPTSQSNPNVSWLNSRGGWIINIIIIVFTRLLLACIPFVSSELAWTVTILSYNFITFFMFHWVRGSHFDFNQNEVEGLTLWEQIDYGAQFTPTKKFLTAIPILLFLISTHYTHYNFTIFLINATSVVIVLIGKLPIMHKVRIFGINKGSTED